MIVKNTLRGLKRGKESGDETRERVMTHTGERMTVVMHFKQDEKQREMSLNRTGSDSSTVSSLIRSLAQ